MFYILIFFFYIFINYIITNSFKIILLELTQKHNNTNNKNKE
jgi:hypothetical protein